MTVTVIVLNYNSGNYLTRCLVALDEQNCDDYRVIVADNNSDDESFKIARSSFKDGNSPGKSRFRFIEFAENTGFARGNNLMIDDVSTPLVALLNPDALPEPGWLRALVSAAQRYPGAAMFGSTQISLADPSRLDGVGDNYLAAGIPWRGGFGWPVEEAPREGEVFSPCAAAAMYRTQAFRSVGGFDEAFFCYVEDVDLGFRLRLAGASCIQVADAVVRHAGGVSSASGGGGFARYHGTRNMIWTFVKNMPGPLFWPLAPVHLAALAVLTVKGFVRGEGRVILRAIGDAFIDLPRVWRQRREIVRGRRASLLEIASALVWNPIRYRRRAPVRFGARISDSAMR